jgi:hypothetical protein
LQNVQIWAIDTIISMFLNTPYPDGPNKCEKWAKDAMARLGQLVECLEAVGLRVRLKAWTYTPGWRNLWNGFGFIDGHFAVEVTLPDGTTIYFDDGNWGGIFEGGEGGSVPPWAN